MQPVNPSFNRCISAICSSIRAVQRDDNFAQSARSGTRLRGSFASSALISSRRESDPLREHDERYPAQHRARKPAMARTGAFRPDQTLLLVETQR
jgi:hypothetical protein